MHTKGPWKAVDNFVVSHVSNAPANCSKSDLISYGGYLIAESIFHPPNQALIAAAPDLLKITEYLFAAFGGGLNTLRWEEVHNIITKAKGQST